MRERLGLYVDSVEKGSIQLSSRDSLIDSAFSRTPPWDVLYQEDRAEMIRVMEERVRSGNETIISEGDDSFPLVVVTRGDVKILQPVRCSYHCRNAENSGLKALELTLLQGMSYVGSVVINLFLLFRGFSITRLLKHWTRLASFFLTHFCKSYLVRMLHKPARMGFALLSFYARSLKYHLK